MSSKLVLGTVQFGMAYGINNTLGKPSQEEVSSILRQARDSGVVSLDTAEAYGEANSRIGEILHELPALERSEYQIIAKFHVLRGQSLEEKLERLLDLFGLKKIWCFQFHRFQDAQDEGEHWEQLGSLKAAGRVAKIGVSLYTNEEVVKAAASPLIDVIQVPFNIFDNLNQRGSVLYRARCEGKEIHARSILLQGLFFRDPWSLPAYFAPLRPWLRRLDALAPTPEEKLRIAIGYVLGSANIDRFLVGVDSLSHWKQISALLHTALSEKERAIIDDWRVENPALLNPATWPVEKK